MSKTKSKSTSTRPELERGAGVLLHITSLPGEHGNGDLGEQAQAFVDFLADAGQRYWQVLPIHPTGDQESPYSGMSAFAGNPLFISPNVLGEQDLLTASELRDTLPEGRFDYARAHAHRAALLRKAFARFDAEASDMAAFRARSSAWLPDYTLYRALRDEHPGQAWTDWPRGLRKRVPEALDEARKSLAPAIAYYEFEQLMFDLQWQRLRAYAAAKRVQLIGDIPIFVAHESADVWAYQHVFQLDAQGQPLHVSGVPPDYFSETGQRWGTPLYAWPKLKREGYRFWVERFRSLLQRFDWVRLDHFIGFARYWQIPAAAPTAVEGRWQKGPGLDLFRVAEKELGRLPFIAEDLGEMDASVEALRDNLGFPGMRVLQFGFGSDAQNSFLPHNYVPHAVAYTGTHDNDTTVGWLERALADDGPEAARIRAYPSVRAIHLEGACRDMVRLLLGSVAKLAIVPMQDLLCLGNEARMNIPGRADGNWSYRVRREQLTPKLAAELRGLCEAFGRIPTISSEFTRHSA